MRGLPAACKPISSPRRGALVFLTLQELRLPHGQMGSDQPTCNHPMGFMATIHRIESGLWAQTGVRNQRNRITGRFQLEGTFGGLWSSHRLQWQLQSYRRLVGAWSTQFLKISKMETTSPWGTSCSSVLPLWWGTCSSHPRGISLPAIGVPRLCPGPARL